MLPQSPVPEPRPDCPRCRGAGWIDAPKDGLAQLAVCDCRGPCPRCDDTGRVLVRVDGVPRVARCRCRQLPDRVELFNRARVPVRHVHCSLQTFRPATPSLIAAHRAVNTWIRAYDPARTRTGLCLWGPAGRGKTHLLVAALRELTLRHGIEVRFVEFSHLLGQLKAGFSKGLGAGETLEPLFQVPVLAIDELGKGRNTDWERTIVDELISRRYNAMLPILATTNYAPRGGAARDGASEPQSAAPVNLALARPRDGGGLGELVDRVGERVYSRLTEMVRFVHLQGPDFRPTRKP